MKSIFVFTFILASVATSTIASPECPERPCEDFGCADEWDPVCATDGNGIYRTFGNSCEIDQYNCGLDTVRCFEMVSAGPCPGTSA
ncbi:Kazal-type serine protease inhibitor domain [Popillia japonica]|uniref:Kazal-type serine protease inhibitor domain n=1 Tax=Popillia japonica TaxID=7064 RepID=A0AAW1KHS1_POPJA